MEIEKYKNYYFSRLITWKKNPLKEPLHKIFEILWALDLGMILWDDIHPSFCETYNVPHRRDYGIDIIDLDNTRTGQVKLYGKTSTITFKSGSTFLQYSDHLNIRKENSYILTTPEAKIDPMLDSCIKKSNIPVKRKSFEDLLKQYKPFLDKFILEENTSVKSTKSQIQIETRDFILKCDNIIKTKEKKIFKFELPPGVGKSYLMFYIILENKEEKFVIFVPWIQLAEQHSRILDKLEVKYQIIGNGNKKVNETSNVIICINPSSKYLESNKFKYKFIDEAHHLEDEDSKYRQFIDKVDCEKEIQLSATFKNQDNLDYCMSFREAVDTGYITDYKVVFEFFTKGDKDDCLIDLISRRHEWFPAFLYVNSTKKAIMFVEKLSNKEVKADYVIANTGIEKQKKIIERIENNEIDVVCLVGCWNEGTSIDNCRSVIFGDMRFSSINVKQIVNRGNRIHIDKPFFNIVIPMVADDLSDDGEYYDDCSNLVKNLADMDPKLKKSIKKNSKSSRIKIGIDGSYKEENLEEDEVENLKNPVIHMSELIFDSLGNMIGRLNEDDKISEFIEQVEKNGIPSQGGETKFSDGTKMGRWFNDIKTRKLRNLRERSEIYQKLSVNETIKKNMDEYLEKLSLEKLSEDKLSEDDKISEFREQVEKNGIPSHGGETKFSDGTKMCIWFQDIKTRKLRNLRERSEIYQKLSVNETIKKNMDEYLEKLSEDKLSEDDKISEFREHVEKKGIPSQGGETKFSDGTKMGEWFKDIKKRKLRNLKEQSEIYQKLSVNETIKKSMDEYLEKVKSK